MLFYLCGSWAVYLCSICFLRFEGDFYFYIYMSQFTRASFMSNEMNLVFPMLADNGMDQCWKVILKQLQASKYLQIWLEYTSVWVECSSVSTKLIRPCLGRVSQLSYQWWVQAVLEKRLLPTGGSVIGFSGAHYLTPERGLAVDATNSNQFAVLAFKLSSGRPSSIFLNRRCKYNIWVDSVMNLTTLCSTCTA